MNIIIKAPKLKRNLDVKRIENDWSEIDQYVKTSVWFTIDDIATAQLVLYKDGTSKIFDLYVQKEYRGNGIATAIIDMIIEYLGDEATYLWVSCRNLDWLKEWYKKKGLNIMSLETQKIIQCNYEYDKDKYETEEL